MGSLTPDWVEPSVFSDPRGELKVLIECHGIVFKRSRSEAGVFRGLHIQRPPHQQEKYIRVLDGSIIDVCLDLNPISPDFGKYFYYELGSTEGFFKIPAHYAHGFFCRTGSVFEYLCLGEYHEAWENIISPSDTIAQLAGAGPWSKRKVSDKDAKAVPLSKCLDDFLHVRWD